VATHESGRIAAIGDPVDVAGFALAGAVVKEATTPEAAREAWASLPSDVRAVFLTANARTALEGEPEAPARLVVTLP
jgi:vacuolar-type H+-ATPase subunit F/Vma7